MDYVALQYAEALFDLAIERKQVNDIQKKFEALLEVLDSDFYTFMGHPTIKNKDKQALIDQIIQDTLLKHLCYVLVDNHRIDLLGDVYEAFEVLTDEMDQVMKVDVYSKKPLSSEEKTKLITSLEKRFSKAVALHNIVEEGIIGGIRLEYKGAVLDDTVNHYFKNLQTRLTK